MTEAQWMGLVIVLLVHTGALFRWGGRIDGALKAMSGILQEHDEEIKRLRVAKHEHANVITAHEAEIDNMKADIEALQIAKIKAWNSRPPDAPKQDTP